MNSCLNEGTARELLLSVFPGQNVGTFLLETYLNTMFVLTDVALTF